VSLPVRLSEVQLGPLSAALLGPPQLRQVAP
jgi:hypothetical protein